MSRRFPRQVPAGTSSTTPVAGFVTHGLTRDCPTPSPSGACPGHPQALETKSDRELIARGIFAATFLRYADALAVAGDRFRGSGRVVYEDARFRVEFDVDPEAHHHKDVHAWLAENGPRWGFQSVRQVNLTITICYREDRLGKEPA